MDLLDYFRALRRRWLLVLVAVVAGASLGGLSTLLNAGPVKVRHYYKATESLYLDESAEPTGVFKSSFGKLDQLALLVTIGDVPDRVAKALNTTDTGSALAEHVLVHTNAILSTLEITASDPDRQTAQDLANEFGTQLIASLLAKDQARYSAATNDTINQLQRLQTQKAQLDAQIAASPGSDLLIAQRDAIVNQYRLTYETFQQLATVGTPTSPLGVLVKGEAVPISASEYNERISRGQLGENVIVGDTTNPNAGDGITGSSSGASLHGPVSRGLLGAFLGLLAGIGLAVLMDRLDNRIQSREDAETVTGLPVVAEVPPLTKAERTQLELLAFTKPRVACRRGVPGIAIVHLVPARQRAPGRRGVRRGDLRRGPS